MISTGLAWIRRQQRSLTRSVLTLFCLVWLQAAAIPCAMAAMPTAMGDAPTEQCPYCPESSPTTGHAAAAAAGAACLYPDEPQVDMRGSFGAAVAPPVVFTSVVLTVIAIEATPAATPDVLPIAAPRPPLPLSYCRFLK